MRLEVTYDHNLLSYIAKARDNNSNVITNQRFKKAIHILYIVTFTNKHFTMLQLQLQCYNYNVTIT